MSSPIDLIGSVAPRPMEIHGRDRRRPARPTAGTAPTCTGRNSRRASKSCRCGSYVRPAFSPVRAPQRLRDHRLDGEGFHALRQVAGECVSRTAGRERRRDDHDRFAGECIVGRERINHRNSPEARVKPKRLISHSSEAFAPVLLHDWSCRQTALLLRQCHGQGLRNQKISHISRLFSQDSPPDGS